MSFSGIVKNIYKTIVPLSIREKVRFRMDFYKHKFHYPYSKFFIHYSYKAAPKVEYTLPQKPLVSVIILNPSDLSDLRIALHSLEAQYYTDYEIVLQCHSSMLSGIRNQFRTEHWIIVEQPVPVFHELIQKAHGKYIGFLPAEDELTPDCLSALVTRAEETHADLIYSDNDRFGKRGKYILPNYKPDYSPFTLLSQNYIEGFSLFRKSLLEKTVAKEEIKGDPYYDLLLRATEQTGKIEHLASILYHKNIAGNKKEVSKEEKESLKNALIRRSIAGTVEETEYPGIFRVKRKIHQQPLVTIITPFKDKPELLKVCLDSILTNSSYQNFEFIGISNNSKSKETFDFMNAYQAKDARIRFYEKNIDFNFSALNNYGASLAKGEHLILLNNDIEIISPDWIETLLEYSQLPETGAIGGKLYFPNEKIQHAGVIVGLSGVAGHAHKMYHREEYGFNGRLHLIQNLSAVTAACLMVKSSLYREVGGLDEKNLAIAFNDVDFCLRLQEKKYYNIFTPYCEAYHYESISRGLEDTPEKKVRFKKEADYMIERHQKILLKGDPYYNVHLTKIYEDFSLR